MTDTAAPTSFRLAVLLPFVIVTLIWGSTWIVIRDQLGTVPPSWSVTYRFLIAGLVMLAYAAYRGEKIALDAHGWAFASALAVLQFCLNFNFVYRAEEHITSGLVAVVFALLLVPNAIFGWIFLGQQLSPRLLAGSAVAMAGVGLLFVHEAQADPNGPAESLIGIGITMMGVLAASIANILQATQTAKRYPMVPTLGIAMLIGAGVDATIAWLLTGPPAFELRSGYVFGVIYLGVMASAVAFTLYFGMLRIIGPAKAAYSSVLVPVIAMLLSTLFEGYHWSSLAAGGAALAMAGLVIALSASKPAR